MCVGVHTIATRPGNERTWQEMLGDGVVGQAFVYYSMNSKGSIDRLMASSVVYIYHTRVGFIGKGKTSSVWKKTVVDDGKVKLSVPLKYIWALSDKSEWGRAVKAREVNSRMQSGHIFRPRAFSVEGDLAITVDEIARENGVLFRSE